MMAYMPFQSRAEISESDMKSLSSEIANIDAGHMDYQKYNSLDGILLADASKSRAPSQESQRASDFVNQQLKTPLKKKEEPAWYSYKRPWSYVIGAAVIAIAYFALGNSGGGGSSGNNGGGTNPPPSGCTGPDCKDDKN